MTTETSTDPAPPEMAGMTTESGVDTAGPEMVGIVLAAGAGTRLRPLTLLRPKPLCPVGNVALVDAVIDRLALATDEIAVNVHAGRTLMEQHFDAGRGDTVPPSNGTGRGGANGDVPVNLSFEEPVALGTAGALGLLRWWIDGRPVLVMNGDMCTDVDIRPFVSAWDGERVSVLVHDPDALDAGRAAQFTTRSRLIATIVPWREVRGLVAEPSGLYERCLAPAATSARLAVMAAGDRFFDCGTPSSYLQANLATAESTPGGSIIAAGAEVAGVVEHSVVGDACVDGSADRCVVWSGASVGAAEILHDAIRTDAGRTVLIR